MDTGQGSASLFLSQRKAAIIFLEFTFRPVGDTMWCFGEQVSRAIEQCRLKQSILLQDVFSAATNSCSEDRREPTYPAE